MLSSGRSSGKVRSQETRDSPSKQDEDRLVLRCRVLEISAKVAPLQDANGNDIIDKVPINMSWLTSPNSFSTTWRYIKGRASKLNKYLTEDEDLTFRMKHYPIDDGPQGDGDSATSSGKNVQYPQLPADETHTHDPADEAMATLARETCTKAKVTILGAGVAGITAAQTLHNGSIHDFIILEHNDYVGGRMKHTTFGSSSDGKPFTVELVKNTYSNDSAIITYDETGAFDYTDLIDLFDEKFEIASQDAGYIFTENLQDTSTRAGLSLAGWKPKRAMKMAAAD
ncbi:polyamine oxidase precursor [Fusarium mundagurra]|uniref:Polyamine oxidase n=1 Tax=Fusarium mundagurra TaxID=1567541 RepID=A0A8H5YSE6_9HYPO|nr:polyamine oxidase precursor [Fusarium mundagurra]